MIHLLIDGTPHDFPRVWTASVALTQLGHHPREVALQRVDGSLVGTTSTLRDALSDGDALTVVRL
jgi:sulfur carrier protein ThiS